MSTRFACLLGALFGGALLLGASTAAAQSNSAIGESNWRQGSRSKDRSTYASSQRFAFELRFGPYYPEVDEEFGEPFGEGGPYSRTFGSVSENGTWDTSAQFYFGLEFDWQALRIPYIGAIGPGFGWGFTRTSAPAKITGTLVESGTDTSLTIMPMHFSAVLRADELMRRTGIPIVPYGKFGLGFATWSASTTTGVSSVTIEEAGQEPRDLTGEGITWGIHMALGGMLALNWLDGRAAATLDETTGVNHIYLFGEWMNANLDGLGASDQMHVGSSTWVLGIAGDF